MRDATRGRRLVLAAALLLLAAATAVRAAADEAAPLQALKQAVAGDAANQLANWSAEGDPCLERWAGVTCTDGRVTAV